MAELDPRKQQILRAVVFEYITAAEPVASETLVQKYELGVKSATIRNELAEMSDLGFLEQPHTSAGRIPSDLGYRYYVDRLIVERQPGVSERERLRDVADEGEALQELLRDTARALSRITHLLTVATTIRDRNVTVRTVVISALGPTQLLLVMAMSDGQVVNRMLDGPAGLTLEEIGKLNEALAQHLVGKSLRNAARAKTPRLGGSDPSERLLGIVWSAVRAIARELTRGATITEGEEFILAQPEFQRDVAALAQLIDDLATGDVLYDSVTTHDPVTIGRENRHEQMWPFSVVRDVFYVGDQEAGVIALVGPKRMAYDRSIPLVTFTAQALSQSLSRFFG